MRRTGVTPPISLLLLFFLLLSNPLPSSSFSFPFSNYRTLFSVSHSLFSRVANLREARGDSAGAARARSIAIKLENGLGIGFWKVMWNVGWDYARNYAWRDTTSFDMFGALSELNEILRGLSDFSSVSSDRERVNWMNRNYENLFRVSKSLFGRFRKMFRHSQGPLKEVTETLQKEVVDGDLLKDCLELGANDLKGLIMVFKDISSKYTSTSSTRTDL
ncbi:uncharacterized protein [Nicotiana sylvestris]|uniref:Uncharacterized protein isoform X1 n=2 Tax=Nicotiana TaxID=4085 RepID=A0A1S4D3U9_TOBAC|nr:PREDICTED: uncharacterized protein LOC104220391 isoform X1 [Nicotiana sylvestris]XP_016508013.1 PREDICTED: uncharacterized protein LOC107825650 isoform X1 [Nicotiana tabacum]